MDRFLRWLKNIFFPPHTSSRMRRILPFVLVIFLALVVLVIATYTWETTNSTVFCGTTCHTMPPQYVTHQNSLHAAITCEDCHLGRAPLAESIRRKVQYSWQTGTATLTNSYTLPIRAKNMRPARDVCETCHYPESFSSDKLNGIKVFADDTHNTPTTTYLILKIGGGSRRAGLGYGIHWHVENPVYFYATDSDRQSIPFVRAVLPGGQTVEYVDIESGFDPKSIQDSQLVRMDCITCHNRAAHDILKPEAAVDQMLARNLLSPSIPFIRKNAVEILKASYSNNDQALAAIESLDATYKQSYPDFYSQNSELLTGAITALKSYYSNASFPDQKMNWETHPNNIGHQNFPGCFRCHDGKHLSTQKEAVRLECNLCHSVPVVSTSSQLVTEISVDSGGEPPSHKSTSWIVLHRQSTDATCSTCHTLDDAGGVSNRSFCSNSACHGQTWQFAGFDAPQLRKELGNLQQAAPAPTQSTPAGGAEKPTFADLEAVFSAKCIACHGDGGMKGVNLTSYASLMQGSENGPLLIPGNSKDSLIYQVQSSPTPHFAQLSPAELAMLAQWIDAGAPEK